MRNLLPKHSERPRQKFIAAFALLSAALLFAACSNAGNKGSNTIGKNSNRSAASNDRNNSELVDLNSASKTQLISLPGIGEAHAQQIIDGRPYREKGDLVRKNIISEKTYELISDKVIARQK